MDHIKKPFDWLARCVHLSLLGGAIFSALLLILGLVLTLARNEPRPVEPQLIVMQVIRGALAGDGPALLNMGIFVLMLTPIARVCVLCIGWLIEREYRFALVSLCVLIFLAISMVIGTR
jgi:uncharacterized membrane protein